MDARARPTKTDHFPIITILELPQDRIKPRPTYDFRLADWFDVLENLSIRLTEIPAPAPLQDDESFQRAVKDRVLLSPPGNPCGLHGIHGIRGLTCGLHGLCIKSTDFTKR